MGLLKKKKKVITNLPKPDMSLKLPRFPEADFSAIKSEVKPITKPNGDIPDLEVIGNIGKLGFESSETISETKPLFVRIERYHEAINDLKKIGEKLRESEKVLNNIIEIKKEEDNELKMWHDNIMELKNKMNRIDHILFEMKI